VHRDFAGFGRRRTTPSRGAARLVLCLDADERVSPQLADAIRALFAGGPPQAPAYAVARRNRFLGRCSPTARATRLELRLFDRRRARWTRTSCTSTSSPRAGGTARGRPDARIGRVDRGLRHQAERYTTLQARALHARGERASFARMALSPLVRFFRFYVIRAASSTAQRASPHRDWGVRELPQVHEAARACGPWRLRPTSERS